MRTVLKVWLPFLPPSSNKIYIRHPKGMGKILSSKARKFKIEAMRVIQQEGRVGFIRLRKNVPYKLTLVFFFPRVENKTSKVGARYKKFDLTNVIKLAEDTVSEAVDVDDSHNFRAEQEKHCDPENPGMYIILSRLSRRKVGLTKEEYDARHP